MLHKTIIKENWVVDGFILTLCFLYIIPIKSCRTWKVSQSRNTLERLLEACGCLLLYLILRSSSVPSITCSLDPWVLSALTHSGSRNSVLAMAETQTQSWYWCLCCSFCSNYLLLTEMTLQQKYGAMMVRYFEKNLLSSPAFT